MAKRTWEQEKAYCAKRAEELKAEMKRATENVDLKAFTDAHSKAMRYMTVKERRPFYEAFIAAYAQTPQMQALLSELEKALGIIKAYMEEVDHDG